MNNQWIKAKVRSGQKIGRTINYPTINLFPQIITKTIPYGVYSSQIKINNKTYLGALFYGHKVINNKATLVLEIHIINFFDNLYDQYVEFKVQSYIRPPMIFSSKTQLKNQIKTDINKMMNINHDRLPGQSLKNEPVENNQR